MLKVVQQTWLNFFLCDNVWHNLPYMPFYPSSPDHSIWRKTFKVQMKCFFYCWIWKSSKNQEDRHLPFLNISSSSRVITVGANFRRDFFLGGGGEEWLQQKLIAALSKTYLQQPGHWRGSWHIGNTSFSSSLFSSDVIILFENLDTGT